MTKALPRDKFEELINSILAYADEQFSELEDRLSSAQVAVQKGDAIPSRDMDFIVKTNDLIKASSIASKYYDRAKDRARPGDQVSAIWEAEMMRKILAYMTDPADPVAAALSRILDRYHRQVDML